MSVDFSPAYTDAVGVEDYSPAYSDSQGVEDQLQAGFSDPVVGQKTGSRALCLERKEIFKIIKAKNFR